MTSILTNISAMTALQTLRGIGSQLEQTQQQVSSGLRVGEAADNAAYWSISTTMRSDNMALSAVSDALGLGAAKVDVAYAGMESTIDVLSEFRKKIVAAKEDSVDRSKIQTELDQFKQQFQSIASSASFSGENWLKTDEQQSLWELSSLPASVVSSFIRSSDGSVSVGKTTVDLTDISLFNLGGGGALQEDPRSLGTIGGFRYANASPVANAGYSRYAFTGGIDLSADTVNFDLVLNENLPHGAGTTHSVTIDKAAVDAALGTTDGMIANVSQYRQVLQYVFSANSIPASVMVSGASVRITNAEVLGQPGSSVAITNVVSSYGTGAEAAGLENAPAQRVSNQYASWNYNFTGPFYVYRDVSFSFDMQVGSGLQTTLTIDRHMVDLVLGTTDGKVTSAADMVLLLNHVLTGQGVNVSASGSQVIFDIDPAMYPDTGTRSHFSIGNVTDSIKDTGPDFGILDVDITDPATDLDNYLNGIEIMLQKVTAGASMLGAVQTRIDLQAIFAETLMDSIDKGIGRLVDADMNEASTRLKALQTQQQLAIQSLQIANSSAENVMMLFR